MSDALTPQLEEILSALEKRPGKVVGIWELAEALWGDDYRPSDPENVIRVGICLLRRHLAREGRYQIVTEWGRGYRLGAVSVMPKEEWRE